MVFVTVKHSIHSARGIAVEEEQDIVYLPMPKAFVAAAPNPIPENLQWQEARALDPVFLFRFSALTFNSHRIHYDLKYATDVEKYPGLVIHGPLQALLLLESAKRNNPGRKPAGYSFRAVRPLFDFDRVSVCGRLNTDGGHDIYTANGDGNIGMQATVSWR
jgi:3-methylfumaryl-CoA hydratase